ncbi:MAG: F0F1 ATP synthase subunit epsilon [Bacteroidales bacterium]|nr:F0F1 ATP synthase subunit epsilon [Bacteroidales bacterium]
MAQEDLQLEIISPDKVLFNDVITLVEVPGKQGRFALLRDHAPIISVLQEGSIRVQKKSGEELNFDCKAGYIECADNHISILLNN